MCKLSGLQILWLNHNQITEIKSLDGLNNLRSLFLDNNKIAKTDDLNKLINLEHVSLKNNPITNIPYIIMNIHNLKYLKVDCDVDQDIIKFINYNRNKNSKTIKESFGIIF